MYLSKSSSGIYFVYYRKQDGKKTRLSCKTRLKSEAYKFLNDFEKKKKLNESKTDITLDELANKYLKIISITHTNQSYYMSKKTIIAFLEYAGKETSILKIDKSIAEGFILKTFEHAKYHGALQLRHLKAVFNKAIEWDYLVKNPFKGIKLKIPENNPEFITIVELNLILEKEKDYTLKNIYSMAFYTGMRRGEILNLEWIDINLTTKEIRVRNKVGFTTKGKKERVIPMSKVVYETLTKLRNENPNSDTGYIFNVDGKKLGDFFVSKRFKKAIRKTKLNDSIHFHSLRHSFCSNLVGKGVNLYVIKKLAGHQSVSTTERYSHLKQESLQQAIELLQ